MSTLNHNAIDAKQERIILRLADLNYSVDEFKEAYNNHTHDGDNPAVYCGTYGKYNNGNLYGQWIDLTTFSDYDEFLNYCLALHADEEEPELMFQDYENFPYEFYDECMGEDEFEKIQKYIELLNDYDAEALEAFLNATSDKDLDNFEEAYQGEFDSQKDFAEHYCDEVYGYELDRMPAVLRCNIDYDNVAYDLFSEGDFIYQDGYVFNSAYSHY